MTKKILIVDDDAAFLKMLQWRIKTEFNFDVVTASRPLEALSMLNSESFDLIVSDIKMPRMSGYELCREVLSNRPQQLVYLMSGFYVDSESLADCGAVKFLQKPFDVGVLRAGFHS